MWSRFARQIEPATPATALRELAANDEADPAEAARTLLKVRLHRRMIDELDLTKLETAEDGELHRAVAELVRKFALEERLPLNQAETSALTNDVINEMLGLGPIEPLLQDPTVDDILINTHKQVYVERRGVLELTPVRFADEAHLLRIVNRIVSAVGRRVDESQPLVDARLPDGSRVNAAIAPVAVDGALVSIRKFSKRPFTLDRLVANGTMPETFATFLRAAVKTRVSILISGGTGSGKTTLLNALSESISHTERLVTIEDAAELQLRQPHVARLETRPPNIEGKGEIRQRELVKNALRMRPDRIILGECRADEAFDLLQAMNTGHEGSCTTVHANSPRDALSRLEQMVAMSGMNLSPASIRRQIASAITLVVQTQRLSDGARRMTSISEVTGQEGDVIQMHELFRFRITGTDPSGAVLGVHEATGIRAACAEWIAARGESLPANLFDPTSKH
jgi:pilus assembly protein CpaF